VFGFVAMLLLVAYVVSTKHFRQDGRHDVHAVMRRPAISLIATTAALLALASPALDLRMGDGGTAALPDSTAAKQGLLAVARDFPSGATIPSGSSSTARRRALRRSRA
jgi:uncharacterized membrane protein YdfJ with MMPL/SSD domain